MIDKILEFGKIGLVTIIAFGITFVIGMVWTSFIFGGLSADASKEKGAKKVVIKLWQMFALIIILLAIFGGWRRYS